ncbi:chitinase [Micromonospora sp. NBC_00858]|uniref:chitinase n=1 Tax=Micromonospora sp. NBC_00858 TaxID=2975979 RepID=UPI00386A2943|nr:chitinase [Micromonospora sp. NBC_00858]
MGNQSGTKPPDTVQTIGIVVALVGLIPFTILALICLVSIVVLLAGGVVQMTQPSPGGSSAPVTGEQAGGSSAPVTGEQADSLSGAQFQQMFPGRNPFYTYQGLAAAMARYPAFAGTGDDTTRKREVAAFLANVSHETGGLIYVEEINRSAWGNYCDPGQPYGCPAGRTAYHGRGPIQLSWNTNYHAAGQALGIDLLNNPDLVKNDPTVAWQTALWFWMTQRGAGNMTPHAGITGGAGFGETIRSINGALECNGGNPGAVRSRISAYQRFAAILGVTPDPRQNC